MVGDGWKELLPIRWLDSSRASRVGRVKSSLKAGEWEPALCVVCETGCYDSGKHVVDEAVKAGKWDVVARVALSRHSRVSDYAVCAAAECGKLSNLARKLRETPKKKRKAAQPRTGESR